MLTAAAHSVDVVSRGQPLFTTTPICSSDFLQFFLFFLGGGGGGGWKLKLTSLISKWTNNSLICCPGLRFAAAFSMLTSRKRRGDQFDCTIHSKHYRNTHTHTASACVVQTVRKTLTLLFVCTLDNWCDLMKFFLKNCNNKRHSAKTGCVFLLLFKQEQRR